VAGDRHVGVIANDLLPQRPQHQPLEERIVAKYDADGGRLALSGVGEEIKGMKGCRHHRSLPRMP
jgi:hypothetical protein